jgi:HEPN domain-containing protein
VDLIIEGHPAELERLRKEIDREVGPEAQLEAVPAQDTEELSEPVLIAVIVALGGPAVTRAIRDVLKRRYENQEETLRINAQLRQNEMQHEYKMAELQLRLRSANGEEREISEQVLEDLA